MRFLKLPLPIIFTDNLRLRAVNKQITMILNYEVSSVSLDNQ
jgi:hypothetical protein